MGGACKVSLLGGFAVEVDGRQIGARDWSTRRASDLVKLTALAPRHRVHREQAAETLWPELGPEAAAANCRKALHYARKALGGDEAIGVESGVLVLWPSGRIDIDVEHFEADANDALRNNDVSRARELVDSYADELLPDDRYAPWAIERRAHIKRMYISLLRVAERWEEILRLDPLDEAAQREVIRALWNGGERQEAIRRFDHLRRMLNEELGIAPHRDTIALYDEILAEEGLEPASPEERVRAHVAAGLVALSRMDAAFAEKEAKAARQIALDSDLPAEMGQAAGLLGMAAHARGRWKAYFRDEFERTLREVPHLAGYVFEANLCLAEFSLHGNEKPGDVAAFARDLLEVAESFGSLQADALATLLLGEAQMYGGDLESAHRSLTAAVARCRDAEAISGSALALQRLAQAELALGRPERVGPLLDEAEEAARASPLTPHLLIRTHATRVEAASADEAVDVLDRTALEREGLDVCDPCSMDHRIASTIALAHARELDRAREALSHGERVGGMWQGGPWQAALWEARGEVRLAEGKTQQALAHLTEAAQLFEQAGHPLAVARCARRAAALA